MRPLLLAVVLLAPIATAQVEAVDWIQTEIAPFAADVKPLQGTSVTTMTTRVSCALAEPVLQLVPLTYTIVSAPAWATISVNPASDVAPAGTCEGGYAEDRISQIIVSASAEAPAFDPGEIVVEVRAGEGPREQREEASVAVQATYFAVLDVQSPESQAIVPPGGSHAFPVRVENFGNGPTRVTTTLVDSSPGLRATLPPAVTLGSRQQGATDTTSSFAIDVAAEPQEGRVNVVGVVNVRLEATYAEPGSFPTDTTNLAFLVTVRSGAEDAESSGERLPVPAIAWHTLAVALTLAAFTARRP